MYSLLSSKSAKWILKQMYQLTLLIRANHTERLGLPVQHLFAYLFGVYSATSDDVIGNYDIVNYSNLVRN